MTRSTTRLLRKITKRFSLNLLSYKPYGSLYKKNAVFRIKTDTGTYALKPFCKNKLSHLTTIQQIKNVTSCARLLTEANYPNMPKWVTTKNNRLWTLKNGKPFYVTNWVNGRSLHRVNDFFKLGKALAMLHSIPHHLPHDKTDLTKHQIKLMKVQYQAFCHSLKGLRSQRLIFRNWFEVHQQKFILMSIKGWRILCKTEIKSLMDHEHNNPSFIHGDITRPNIVIAGDEVYLIDWDRVKIGSSYLELMKAMMNTAQFNPVYMHALLSGYEEIKPLNSCEKKLIYALFLFPREAWDISRFPNSHNNSTRMKILARTWPFRMKAIAWLKEWAYQPTGHA